MRSWRVDKPPHMVVVEVDYDGVVVQARAIWGDRDKGILPHWEFANGVLVEPKGVRQWRYLHDDDQAPNCTVS